MKKITLLVLIYLPAFQGIGAQTPGIDSLRRVMANTRGWQERIDIQQSIGYAFHGISMDSTQRYADLILRSSEKHDYDRGRGIAWRMIGESLLYKAQNEEALAYLQKSEDAFRACGDKSNLAVVLSNSAYALELLCRYGECSDKLVAVIEIAREMNDTAGLAEGYRYYSTILFKQGRPEDALDYLSKGLAIWLSQGNSPHYFYSMMGEIFSKLGQRDSTFYYSKKALAAAEQTGIPRYIALEHNNMGRYYFIWGDHRQARLHYLEALAYFEKKGSNINLPVLYNNMAENENALGNYNSALEYAQKGMAFIGQTRNFMQLSSAHHNLCKSYEGLGDFPAALKHSLLWKSFADSLNQSDNAQKVAEVESRYRTGEQKATIAQQQLQLERQQNRQRIFLLLALLLLAAAAVFVFFLRSKRQSAELALRLKAAEAQHLRDLDQVKSAFFANISHEFRTPLTLILSPLREMEQGTFKGNTAKYFGIMRRNAERLLQLINQLLDLSRLESGKLQIQPRPGDLYTGLRAMAYSFESLAVQRQVQYNIDVPDEPLPALFDRDKLEIIAANLLSNAFKFTPEEGRVLFSASKTAVEDGLFWLTLTVTDNGMGIPAEQQPQVFDRFYQVENTGSDLQPGSGIGLALTKEIVALHGGSISLKSPVEPGTGGTAFTVRLPFKPATYTIETPDYQGVNTSMPHQDVSGISGEQLPVREPASSRHLPLLLIVEDNADVRAYVAEQLRGQYRVLEAADGSTALEMARTALPDLILSDLMMPVMDGIALTRLLKSDEHTSHIPVILLTAKAGRPDRLQGLETGAEAYLTKPFDADELRLVVANTIAQRQVLREKFSREIRLGLNTVAAPSVDELFLQKVLACIEENLDDDMFGVEQLAAGVNMSRSNLFRKLDALTGKSPTTIIRELRLTRAKSLLEQGAGNTTEVSFMVGFNTPAYFVKCFTDEYGMSPGEVRKKGPLKPTTR